MTESHAFRLAVASGKGGTGKTFVAVSLFYILQEKDLPLCLADCDAEAPNAMLFFKGEREKTMEVTQSIPLIDEEKCTFCGRCHEVCTYQAIFILPAMKVIRVMEEICHDCGACYWACREDAITEKEISLGEVSRYRIAGEAFIVESRTRAGVYSPVSLIKAGIAEAGNKGIIILDAPPGTSCPFIQTVAPADYVILVTEPTPFGLSDLKQSAETLRSLQKPFGVIINRAGIGDQGVQQYLKEQAIPLLLEIPFDPALAVAYARGLNPAASSQALGEALSDLFNKIVAAYGNCSHQR
ncbi:MAG TPA: ATP-binding protein [Bacteroidales bacterium]|nr:ATP-binding protein [Bacteroidales bacterium]HSA43012.1 ATP-binding protein [Bacteroidales bacterium]